MEQEEPTVIVLSDEYELRQNKKDKNWRIWQWYESRDIKYWIKDNRFPVRLCNAIVKKLQEKS